jgi:hypothetical protein
VFEHTQQNVQLIQIQDEGQVELATSSVINSPTNSAIVKGSTAEKRTHTIPDFLNRLYEIDSFSWVSSDTAGTVLKTYRFPDVLLALPQIRNKISGFYGLRAGVELQILTASQKFQAGYLLMNYCPNARYAISKAATHAANNKGIVCRTGSPRTTLDLMDGTRAVLRAPYASPFAYYNLITGEGTIADFYISVYSILQDVAAAGSINVRVMARFIDVDLEFPTGLAPLLLNQMPQFTEISEKLQLKPSRSNLVEAKKKLDALLSQVDSGEIQFQMNTVPMKQKALPNMCTYDTSDVSHIISSGRNTDLKKMNMGKASSDEMSFNSIMKIPCYYDRFTQTTAQVSGTNLYSTTITPLKAPNITNTDLSISSDYIYHIASLFKKWRGGFIFHFHVVKTTFHNTKIRVWFAPGTTTEAGVDRNSVYSKIVELSTENNFTFTIPYIHPYNYLNTTTSTTSLGVMGVDVLNKMVAPDSVKNSIEFIVERSADEDLSFALPSSMKAFPFNPTVRAAALQAPVARSLAVKPRRKPVHHVSTKDLTENGFVKDLTTEGIESNPGPVAIFSVTLSNTTTPQTLTSPFYGYQRVTFNIWGNDTRPTIGITGDITGSLYADDDPEYYDIPLRLKKYPTITFTYPGATGSYRINGMWTTDDSSLMFQMNTEQDQDRKGTITDTIMQPQLCHNLGAFCQGDTINNISQMIQRSTLFVVTTTTDSRTIHLMTHGFGVCDKNAAAVIKLSGVDNISYFAHLFAFARGGVNYRLQTTGQYRVLLSPNNDIDQTINQEFGLIEQSGNGLSLVETLYSANLVQQSINTSVEGYGEFTVPFYSSTYCYSVDPQYTVSVTKATNEFTLPDTQILIFPQQNLSEISCFRNAKSDYEFSYLSGPPLLLPIA